MRIVLASAVVIAAPMTAYAQSATRSPDAVAERFLQALKGGKIDEALKDISSDSKLLATRLAADPTLATQIDGAMKAYGPVLSWERIGSDTLGTTVRRDTYLVRHSGMVTRWRFVFFRAESGWSVASFAFEDQLPTWFNEPR